MERPWTRRPEPLMPDPDIRVSKTNSKKQTHEQFKPAGVLFKEFDSEPPWKKQTHRQDTLFKEVDSAAPWKLRGRPRSEETAKLDRLVSNIGTVSVQGGASSGNPVSSTRVTFKGVVDAATNPVHFDPRGGLPFARQVFDAVKRSGSPPRVKNVPDRATLLTPSSSKKFKCIHEGCGKSYSRAEHLYRHQLCHAPKHIYRCDYPDCTRSFVRQDLCNRHRERHTTHGSQLHQRYTFIQGTNTTEGLVEPVQIKQDSSPRFSVSKVAQSKLFVPYTISQDVSRSNSENCNRLCALKQRPSHLEMRKMQVAEKESRIYNDNSPFNDTFPLMAREGLLDVGGPFGNELMENVLPSNSLYEADPISVKRARNTEAARKSHDRKLEEIIEGLKAQIEQTVAERDYYRQLAYYSS